MRFFYQQYPFFSYFCLGLFGTLGFAPFNLFPVFFVLLAYLLAKFYQGSISLRIVFAFFIGFHVSNLYWLVFPLTFNILAHFWLVPFAIILIPAFLSTQILSIFIVEKYCFKVKSASFLSSLTLRVFLFPLIYATQVTTIGSIFPWVLPAYIWNVHEVFMQLLSACGAYGLSYFTVFIASLLAGAIVSRKEGYFCNCFAYLAAAFAMFLSMCIFGVVRLSENHTEYSDIAACMVQPNITDNERKHNRRNVLRKLVNMSIGHNASNVNYKSGDKLDILIWPEASVPYLYNERMLNLRKMIVEPLKGRHNSILVAGAIREGPKNGEYYNSAIFIDSLGKHLHSYDKVHLVPFGEYVPFRSWIPQRFAGIASDIGDFSRGEIQENRKPFKATFKDNNGRSVKLNIAVAICYEAVFVTDCIPSDIMTDKTNNSSSEEADILINLTNDGWFGFTTQPYQHLQIVRARAVEMGIPVIRAANVGISAVFDPMGREIAKIRLNGSGNMNFRVPQKTKNKTRFMTLFSKLRRCFKSKDNRVLSRAARYFSNASEKMISPQSDVLKQQ